MAVPPEPPEQPEPAGDTGASTSPEPPAASTPPGPVRVWLTEQGLGEHAERFDAEGLTMGEVKRLTEDDLRELGVEELAQRKRLLIAIERERRSFLERLRNLGLRGVLDAVVLVSTVILTAVAYVSMRDAAEERQSNREERELSRSTLEEMRNQSSLSIRPAIVAETILRTSLVRVEFDTATSAIRFGISDEGSTQTLFAVGPGPDWRTVEPRFLRLRNTGPGPAIDVRVRVVTPRPLEGMVARARELGLEGSGVPPEYLTHEGVGALAFGRPFVPHDTSVSSDTAEYNFPAIDGEGEEVWLPFPTGIVGCLATVSRFGAAARALRLRRPRDYMRIAWAACPEVGLEVTYDDLSGERFVKRYEMGVGLTAGFYFEPRYTVLYSFGLAREQATAAGQGEPAAGHGPPAGLGP